MLDRMGALGMISVFDVEEVGGDTLTNDVGMSEELAANVLECCSVMAREVQEQQEREKEEEEKRKAEEQAALEEGAGSEGEAAAASILGEGPSETDESTEADAEAAAASILDGNSSVSTTEEEPLS